MAVDPSSILDNTQSWAVRMAVSALRNYPRECWKWHYEHGLLIKAFAAVEEANRGSCFQEIDQAWVDHFVTENGEIRTYHPAEFSLDQINPGKLLFPLYHRTGADRYAAAL